ncbi:MAG TPA: flagellar hook-associated protein FlgK [Terracidiphilus sp.]|nr:flagellar hook-associated protein FlgK [Terracidiphilus sp.]
MGTINSAFGLISGALDADQSALNVVANNVANANTTGYTEEKPNWQENAPITVNGVTIGQGVTETGATSQRDRVLEERLDQQQQLASASSTRLSALNEMQALFTPDSGSANSTAGDVGSDITSFFDSFSSLESDPTDNALRESVLSSASTLAGDISSAAASLNSQRSAIDQEASGVASQVNSLTSALAQVNQQIESTSPDADAGTLEDQRQQDLSQLSQLIGINQITTSDNGLEITTTSGQLLVAGSQSYQLTTGTVSGVTDFFLGGNDITAGLTTGGGQLGGYLTARDQDIPNALSSLDQLAYSISTSVNAANNTGTDLDGNEGTGTNSAGVTGTGTTPLYIFNEPTQVAGSAAAMSVTMTDPNQIAAAGFGDGTGDNSNAIAIYNLGGQQIVNGQTPTDYYSNFVTTLGSTVSEVQTENTAQNASVTQLQTQNNALSSVNLNDEAAAMSTLESSYQAASQVFNMLNTVMTSALNLGVETAVS